MDMFEDAKQQMILLPRPVQLWMRWLNIVFLIGIFFAFTHVTARLSLLAYIVCFPVAVVIFYYTRNIRLTGISHIVFWTPLMIYLPYAVSNDPDFNLLSIYGIWVLLLCLTVAISVMFDVRAFFAILAQKRES
ncbi:MAG: hypothetical protein P1U83_16910 [Roseovarius sp.]|nr:hypothetical protein [Roseovarius sp.]